MIVEDGILLLWLENIEIPLLALKLLFKKIFVNRKDYHTISILSQFISHLKYLCSFAEAAVSKAL